MEINDYPLDALDAAQRAQARKGWSDRMVLAQCLAHVLSHYPSLYGHDDVEAIEGDLRSMTEATDAERFESVARRLELCFGYFGSEWLDESLTRQPAMTAQEAEDQIAGFPGPTYDPRVRGTREMDPRFRRRRQAKTRAERRAAMRQPLLIVLGSLAAMVALAVVIVLLGG